MRITLRAARSKGATPSATREAEVERDGGNVFLAFPEPAGVVDNASAVALGNAILTAAGVTAASAEASIKAGIPAGWTLNESADGTFSVNDTSGVVRGVFHPVTQYVAG